MSSPIAYNKPKARKTIKEFKTKKLPIMKNLSYNAKIKLSSFVNVMPFLPFQQPPIFQS